MTGILDLRPDTGNTVSRVKPSHRVAHGIIWLLIPKQKMDGWSDEDSSHHQNALFILHTGRQRQRRTQPK